MPKKQKNGLYRSHITIGNKADGTPVYKYVSGRTKAELEQAKREAQAYYIGGTGLEEDRLFGDYVVEWYKVRKEPFIAPSTATGYATMMNKYVLPAFGDRNLRAVSATDLQKFLNGFTGRSSTTIAQAKTVLQGVYSAAVADHIVSYDPSAALRSPKPAKRKERRGLTEDETAKVLHLIETHEHGAYLGCLYYLGVRPGEARGLMWGDFDWEALSVHIQRDIDYQSKNNPVGALKTEMSDRYIPVPDELVSLLKPLRGHPKAFLFTGSLSGEPLSKASAERIWLSMMQAGSTHE